MIELFKCEDGSLFRYEMVVSVRAIFEIERKKFPDKSWVVKLNGYDGDPDHYISQNDYERFMKLASDKAIVISII